MHRLPMTDRQGHTPGRRIQDIELLRALAVVSVVVHHAHGNLFHWPTPLFDAFFRRFELWWGVDLFFAISGFVIARDLIPRLQGCNGVAEFWRNSVQFWVRRAFRLLPSAWLWLLLMLVACRFLNESGAFGTLSANLAATLAGILQYANFRFADSFFRYEYGVSFVYWSLSLEEQFYLLLPLLIFVSRRFLPWILVGVIAAQFFVWRTPLLMVLRTDALAWGVLLALASHKAFYVRLEPTWLLRWRPLGLILAALLVLGLTRVSTEQHLWSVWRIGVIALFSAARFLRSRLPGPSRAPATPWPLAGQPLLWHLSHPYPGILPDPGNCLPPVWRQRPGRHPYPAVPGPGHLHHRPLQRSELPLCRVAAQSTRHRHCPAFLDRGAAYRRRHPQ